MTQEELLPMQLKLCTDIASTYRNHQMYDDLVQEGLLACAERYSNYLKVASDFDKPEQYFYFIAKGAISSFLSHGSKLITPSKTHKGTQARVARDKAEDALSEAILGVSGQTYVGLLDDSGQDYLESDDDHAGDYELKDYINKCEGFMSDNLSDDEFEVIYLRYLSTDRVRTFADVGKVMGIHRATVSDIEKSALKVLMGLK